MRNHLVVIGLIVITGLLGFRAAENWTKYKSAEGRFSIDFPGKPEESTQDDKSDDGTPFKIHFTSYSPNDDEVYMCGWIDMTSFYPKDKELKVMLEDSRDGATGSMKATNVKTLTTYLGDNPYIEFTFEADKLVGKDRIYIINKFQYSVITIFSDKTGIRPGADKFIASFRPAGTM
jgi:hypothetical protein